MAPVFRMTSREFDSRRPPVDRRRSRSPIIPPNFRQERIVGGPRYPPSNPAYSEYRPRPRSITRERGVPRRDLPDSSRKYSAGRFEPVSPRWSGRDRSPIRAASPVIRSREIAPRRYAREVTTDDSPPVRRYSRPPRPEPSPRRYPRDLPPREVPNTGKYGAQSPPRPRVDARPLSSERRVREMPLDRSKWQPPRGDIQPYRNGRPSYDDRRVGRPPYSEDTYSDIPRRPRSDFRRQSPSPDERITTTYNGRPRGNFSRGSIRGPPPTRRR
uniref:Uncharacterized protein n=1 Tax=Schistocephalus solidus TaxID=70667 RepID=A0A0X3QBA8_SCHSO